MSTIIVVLLLALVGQSLCRPQPWYANPDGVGAFPEGQTLECQKGDIAFVIDSSSSIWPEDYLKGVEFVANLARDFNIGPDNIRMAAVSFGDRVYDKDAFGFDRYLTSAALIRAIQSMPHKGGPRTETGLGIKYMREHLLTKARPNLPKIAIVITDGQSQKKEKTAREASLTKREGVTMFAIGVSHNSSQDELQRIASKESNVFWVKDYTALTGIEQSLVDLLDKIVCDEPEPLEDGCGGPVDVYYVFDGAYSGGLFIREATVFINKSVEEMQILQRDFNVGVISSDCAGVDSFPLNRYRTLTQVQTHMNFYVQSSLDALVDELRNYGFSGGSGGRQNARRVGVLFVDDKVPLSALKVQTDEAKRQGIELFVVGVDRADNSYIRALASSPDSRYFFAHNGANMRALGADFIRQLCHTNSFTPYS